MLQATKEAGWLLVPTRGAVLSCGCSTMSKTQKIKNKTGFFVFFLTPPLSHPPELYSHVHTISESSKKARCAFLLFGHHPEAVPLLLYTSIYIYIPEERGGLPTPLGLFLSLRFHSFLRAIYTLYNLGVSVCAGGVGQTKRTGGTGRARGPNQQFSVVDRRLLQTVACFV